MVTSQFYRYHSERNDGKVSSIMYRLDNPVVDSKNRHHNLFYDLDNQVLRTFTDGEMNHTDIIEPLEKAPHSCYEEAVSKFVQNLAVSQRQDKEEGFIDYYELHVGGVYVSYDGHRYILLGIADLNSLTCAVLLNLERGLIQLESYTRFRFGSYTRKRESSESRVTIPLYLYTYTDGYQIGDEALLCKWLDSFLSSSDAYARDWREIYYLRSSQPKPEAGNVSPEEKAEVSVAEGRVDHPGYYGGKDSPYETIKVIEAWLGSEATQHFCLGNALKYLSRADKKSEDGLTDLKKARWYLEKLIEVRESQNEETKPSFEDVQHPSGNNN